MAALGHVQLAGSEVPQPSTFAPSKDDVLNALGFYFGAPVSPEKLKDYNEHHAATYHFPDAYAGSNTAIRDTINNLVEKSPQQWHTSIGLPFRKIEGTVVEWDEIRFDVRLMQRVPYEGVSRMTTSMKRKHRDRIVRRGLAMMIESDFYTTDAGRNHFQSQLQSIRYCVQETCNYDVLFAYLTSHNYDFAYDKSHSVRPKRNIRQAMQHEITMYAVSQKEDKGLDKAVEECKYRMKRYGVTPNLLVIPPQLALYMSLAPDEKITYKEGGPAAIVNFEAGVDGFTTRAFRGCGVVTSDPFEVSDEMEAVQMLQRFTQVGEFYVMSKPEGIKEGAKGFMDLLIYDEESDRHVKITYEKALESTGLLTAAPTFGVKAGTIDGGTLLTGGVSLTTWADNASKLSKANLSGAKADIDEVAGLDAPIVIARPFIEHAMLSAVLTVSGGDTGATIFGPSDMQVSANTSVKTIEGHYTGHFKAVITKPQNVYVMKDIMANGYRAGGNTKFFGDTIEKIKKELLKRLNFEDDFSSDPVPSMLAFPMSAEQYETGNMDTAMSITSRFLPWEVTGGKHNSFPGGDAMFEKYNTLINLRAVHFGEDLRASENMEYVSQGSTNNALCFLGPHRKFDTVNGGYGVLVPGMGHWGPDARPGDARWRRGESVNMTSAREAMLTYEQLAYIPRAKA